MYSEIGTTTSSANNKRIAKNTLFLFFRSIFILSIGLYTSREIIAQFGVSDFGTYGIVGSVIVLFSFIDGAMNNATSRFITYDLGLGDFERLKKTFSLSVVIHIFTALFILILGETIGLWFLNTQLVIPAERMGAANFVYQFSILSACIGILQVPYMAAVTAHERMHIITYAGIVDAGLKLVIVLALRTAPFDKMKFYAVLLFAVYISMVAFYRIYCHRNFKETHFKWFWDKKLFWERFAFSGWTTLSGVSGIAASQGITILLNMFYGVLVNAAYTVMSRVTDAINQFANNFFTAVNPQITKSYAKGDMDYLHSLLFRAAKFSFLITFAISIPLVLNMDLILRLWLREENVPEYAVIFCKIRVIDWVIWMIATPLATAIISTGKVKHFMLIDSILIFMNFLLTFLFLSQGYSPVVVPWIYLSVNVFRSAMYLYFAKKQIHLSVRQFFRKVYFRLILVILISIPFPLFISFYTENWVALFTTSGSFGALFLFSAIFAGLEKNERTTIFSLIKNRIKKK